jgi:hypothetical protein
MVCVSVQLDDRPKYSVLPLLALTSFGLGGCRGPSKLEPQRQGSRCQCWCERGFRYAATGAVHDRTGVRLGKVPGVEGQRSAAQRSSSRSGSRSGSREKRHRGRRGTRQTDVRRNRPPFRSPPTSKHLCRLRNSLARPLHARDLIINSGHITVKAFGGHDAREHQSGTCPFTTPCGEMPWETRGNLAVAESSGFLTAHNLETENKYSGTTSTRRGGTPVPGAGKGVCVCESVCLSNERTSERNNLVCFFRLILFFFPFCLLLLALLALCSSRVGVLQAAAAGGTSSTSSLFRSATATRGARSYRANQEPIA